MFYHFIVNGYQENHDENDQRNCDKDNGENNGMQKSDGNHTVSSTRTLTKTMMEATKVPSATSDTTQPQRAGYTGDMNPLTAPENGNAELHNIQQLSVHQQVYMQDALQICIPSLNLKKR